jgi:hypothetical protein
MWYCCKCGTAAAAAIVTHLTTMISCPITARAAITPSSDLVISCSLIVSLFPFRKALAAAWRGGGGGIRMSVGITTVVKKLWFQV